MFCGERDTTRDFFNPALNHQDNPLTTKGVQQAERLGGYLSDKSIWRIIVSQYQRTLQTAMPASQKLNLVPQIDRRVNEIDNERFEMPRDQISAGDSNDSANFDVQPLPPPALQHLGKNRDADRQVSWRTLTGRGTGL